MVRDRIKPLGIESMRAVPPHTGHSVHRIVDVARKLLREIVRMADPISHLSAHKNVLCINAAPLNGGLRKLLLDMTKLLTA